MNPEHSVARGSAPQLEILEERCLLSGSPDLEVALIAPPQEVVPGDKFVVSATITNVGDADAVGPAHLAMWSSGSATPSHDFALGSLDIVLALAPGQSIQRQFLFTVGPDAQPGNCWIFAELTPDPSLGDANLANNTDIAGAPTTLAWKFGTFGGRRNVTLSVLSKDMGQGAVPVTIRMTGGGWGEVIGGEEFQQITVHDSTPASTMTISTPVKGSEVEVGRIVVLGPLRGLDARTTDVGEALDVSGALARLTLDDAVSCTIDINSALGPADPAWTCAITLDEAEDLTLNTHGVPVRSLRATEIRYPSSITAPWMGSLTTVGDSARLIEGDLGTDLTLTGRGTGLTLGGIRIKDDAVQGVWDITGNVGDIVAGDWIFGVTVNVRSSLRSVKAMAFEDCVFDVDGPVGSISIQHWLGSNVSADSLGRLKCGPIYRSRLDLAGAMVAPGAKTLGSAAVGDIFDSAALPNDRGWVIHGPVGAVKTGDVTDWLFRQDGGPVGSLTVGAATNAEVLLVDALGTLRAKSWRNGRVEAASVGSLNLTGDKKLGIRGDWLEGVLRLSGEGLDPIKQDALRSLRVVGLARHLSAVIDGNVGTATAGAMQSCEVLVGCDALTKSVGDFDDGLGGACQYRLRSLTLTGLTLDAGQPAVYFQDSQVGAWAVGTLKFNARPYQPTGFVECHTFGKTVNPPLAGAPVDPLEIVTV